MVTTPTSPNNDPITDMSTIEINGRTTKAVVYGAKVARLFHPCK